MTRLISIVTPTFNEEENIEKLCQEINHVMKNFNYDYEHIVVDNCSTDNTISKLRKLASNNKSYGYDNKWKQKFKSYYQQ